MQVPLELTFRDVEKSAAVESLIREQVGKLEQVCDHIVSCHVAVEQPQAHQRSGSRYRVRIDVRVPPGHEIVVRREPTGGTLHEDITTVIRDAFQSMRRRLEALDEIQEGRLKSHPAQDSVGIVARFDPKTGFGFIRAPDAREVYFHRNSVLNGASSDLQAGDTVRYVEEMGHNGPQASTVHLVERRPRARPGFTS